MAERPQRVAPRRRAARLSRSAEFDRVYRQGRSVANRHLVLYMFPRGGDDPLRLGLSVGKKVGGAVERNLVKRLLREVVAAERDSLAGGYDVVIVARPSAATVAEEQGLAGIAEALGELLEKAGLRGAGS